MEKQTITFDFDRTLCLSSIHDQAGFSFAPHRSIPSEMMVDKFHTMSDEGHSVNILTTRMDAYMDEVHEFVKAFNLKPDNVWNTNFVWKSTFIHRLMLEEGIRIDEHIDDNPHEFELMISNDVLDHVKLSLVISEYGSPPKIIDYRNIPDEDRGTIWRLMH